MKKSEAFHKAQLSVLNDPNITFEETLEVLAILMEEEKWAKHTETTQMKVKNDETV